MTVPSYTTDLSDITTADSGTFTEFTNRSSGGTPAAETDYYIQGTGCQSATAYTKAAYYCSIAFDYGSGITVPSGGAVLFWHWFGCPTSLDTIANGGVRGVIGSAIGAYKEWYVGGNATPPMPYGGWKCYAVDPTLSADYTTSPGPTSTLQFFGMSIYLGAGVSRGNIHALDAIRYGRCEIRARYGETANYANFSGMAFINDTNSALGSVYNRWGLFSYVNGVYMWKGLMSLGYSGVAVDFRDSNRAIFVEDTIKVSSGFNKIEVNEATSRVDWTGISITALGTVSKGAFEMKANADINWESCTFTDMDTFIFMSNATVNNTVFRRCGQVTVGGGTFTNCNFDQSTAASAVSASSPAEAALISNSTFTSDGTGYGITITGSAANITLTNVDFSGYAASDGSTGNEAIYINIAAGSMNLTIDGGTEPSIRTAGCAVTKILSSRTVGVYTKTTSGAVIGSANVFLAATGASGPFPADEAVSIVNSGTTATVTHTGHGMATNDYVLIYGASIEANNGVFQITKTGTDTYTYTMGSSPGSNPTGAKATFVFLKGLTDSGTGYLSMSREISADQQVIGWARKSSSAPYYKTGTISGTVSSSQNTYFTAVMASDE